MIIEINDKLVTVSGQRLQALAISSKYRVYAYDAHMLVCAQQSGSPLLTFDEALWAHASELGIEVLGDGV